MPRYYRRLSLRLFLPDMCLRLHVTTRVCLLPLRTYVVFQLFLGMLQCAEGLVRRALRRQLLSCPESVWFDDNDGDDDDEQRECALAPLQHTTCNPAALLQWPHLSSVRSYLIRCESPTSRTVQWRVDSHVWVLAALSNGSPCALHPRFTLRLRLRFVRSGTAPSTESGCGLAVYVCIMRTGSGLHAIPTIDQAF